MAGKPATSGWQVFDNKSRLVERYEPFFAHGWDYQPEDEAKYGRHATVFYDPRGVAVRTANARPRSTGMLIVEK